MQAVDIEFVHGNQLVKDYLAGGEKMKRYFPIDLHNLDEEIEGIVWDKNNRVGVDRKAFVSHLLRYHESLDVGSQTIENIVALENEETLVVVSGQQAGLLTGPLYTIYKIITTIHLSKEYTERLGRKVVPVFWVAGEDHDYLEVNHVHILDEENVRKKSYSEMQKKKVMVSEIELKKEKMMKWVQSIFVSLGETEYTRDLLVLVEKCIDNSNTITEFFVNIIVKLFKEEGLVLFDSGNKMFRSLQVPCFRQIIEKNDEVREGLKEIQRELRDSGYSLTLDVKEQAAHLFYELDGERVLLYREKDGFRVGETNLFFTEKELVNELEKFPEKFSNNVVTRPIMQEWLFPTLFFVGGPGEIAYWGELKQVFRQLDTPMPIVFPRISLTVVERNIAHYVDKLNVTYYDVFENRMDEKKQAYLRESVSVPLEDVFKSASEQLQHIHTQLQRSIKGDFPQLTSFGERNQEILLKELSVYKRQVEKELHQKHDVVLKQYTAIENHLCPLGSGQERVLNIFYFLNLYGLDFVSQLVQVDMPKTFQHKMIMM